MEIWNWKLKLEIGIQNWKSKFKQLYILNWKSGIGSWNWICIMNVIGEDWKWKLEQKIKI